MGRGMIPANRVRDAKGVGEVDWTATHAKVYVPNEIGGYTKVFVKITKGDHLNGQGIIDDEKPGMLIKLGTPIEYRGGTENGVVPKFLKRLHSKNKKDWLLEQVAKQLVSDMQMKPTAKENRPRRAKSFVPARTITKYGQAK